MHLIKLVPEMLDFRFDRLQPPVLKSIINKHLKLAHIAYTHDVIGSLGASKNTHLFFSLLHLQELIFHLIFHFQALTLYTAFSHHILPVSVNQRPEFWQ